MDKYLVDGFTFSSVKEKIESRQLFKLGTKRQEGGINQIFRGKCTLNRQETNSSTFTSKAPNSFKYKIDFSVSIKFANRTDVVVLS